MGSSCPPRLLIAALVVLVVAAACGSDDADPAEAATPVSPTAEAAPDEPAADEPAADGSSDPTPDPAPTEQLRVQVVAEHPHDSNAFTQGLLIEDGRMFESTGLYGESTLREVEPSSGTVVRSIDVAEEFFAEGLELVDDELVQLTWQEQRAFVYDADTFDLVGQLPYETEGWGLCFDGDSFVMSDGSATLTRRDPDTFAVLSTSTATLDGEPVEWLNELECVDGQVYANVWRTDTIVRIEPDSGRVTAVIDATGLYPDRVEGVDVMNGIAFDEATGRFWVTGKLWPVMFEVDFVPA